MQLEVEYANDTQKEYIFLLDGSPTVRCQIKINLVPSSPS